MVDLTLARDERFPPPSGARSFATTADYVALLKPRVMTLVVFTGLVGMAIAPDGLHPVLALAALLAIAAGAGASGALNMALEADLDRVMDRTSRRPIPRGVVPPQEAMGLGLFLALLAVMTMSLAGGVLAAGLLAFTILFYVVVYTMVLKRRTPQNIVIGGLAGALPPAIGWAAATGSLAPEPLALVLLIFLWTPAHFWALALTRTEDYARAGVPMLPVRAGRAATQRAILLYTVLTLAASALPLLVGGAGLLYGVTAALLGIAFLVQALRLARAGAGLLAECRRHFGLSILYLFALFASRLIEALAGLPALRELA